MQHCENRLCTNWFEPNQATLNQPKEKQQKYCTKNCREQVYQIGRHRIVSQCAVEISWPLLTVEEKNLLEPYLKKTQGYGVVKTVLHSTGQTQVEIDGHIFTLNKLQLVRI